MAEPNETVSAGRIVQRLKQARTELRESRPEQVVQTCRKVLENLAELHPLPKDAPLRQTNPRERTSEERWAAVHHAVTNLAHLAVHDTDSNAEWSYRDAEAILTVTAGLAARGLGSR